MLYDLQKAKMAHKMLAEINKRLAIRTLEVIAENNELSVTDIYVRLRCDQSVASQCLMNLNKTGLLKSRRDGKNIYYSINKNRLNLITDTVNELSDMYECKLTHRSKVYKHEF